MGMASERYPLSYGWPKSDISSTAVWVRAAGADIARFGEARPLLPASLPPMTEAIRQASDQGVLLRCLCAISNRTRSR